MFLWAGHGGVMDALNLLQDYREKKIAVVCSRCCWCVHIWLGRFVHLLVHLVAHAKTQHP